jgi:hypothetical protein
MVRMGRGRVGRWFLRSSGRYGVQRVSSVGEHRCSSRSPRGVVVGKNKVAFAFGIREATPVLFRCQRERAASEFLIVPRTTTSDPGRGSGSDEASQARGARIVRGAVFEPWRPILGSRHQGQGARPGKFMVTQFAGRGRARRSVLVWWRSGSSSALAHGWPIRCSLVCARLGVLGCTGSKLGSGDRGCLFEAADPRAVARTARSACRA